jgi:hypothetical protein
MAFQIKKFLYLVKIMNLQVYVWFRRNGVGNLDLRYFTTCVLFGLLSSLLSPVLSSTTPETPQDTKDPMKLFLVHTMLFVGSIWKNKSG